MVGRAKMLNIIIEKEEPVSTFSHVPGSAAAAAATNMLAKSSIIIIVYFLLRAVVVCCWYQQWQKCVQCAPAGVGSEGRNLCQIPNTCHSGSAQTRQSLTKNTTMAASTRQLLACLALLFACLLNSLSLYAHAFSVSPSFHLQRIQQSQHHNSCLFVKKKKSSKQAKTSGFGGKAIEPCPCGSGLGYMKCCGKLHTDSTAFANATPEQIVRARYSAYAKRQASARCMLCLLVGECYIS